MLASELQGNITSFYAEGDAACGCTRHRDRAMTEIFPKDMRAFNVMGALADSSADSVTWFE